MPGMIYQREMLPAPGGGNISFVRSYEDLHACPGTTGEVAYIYPSGEIVELWTGHAAITADMARYCIDAIPHLGLDGMMNDAARYDVDGRPVW